jgi:hypothetical protein
MLLVCAARTDEARAFCVFIAVFGALGKRSPGIPAFATKYEDRKKFPISKSDLSLTYIYRKVQKKC